MLTRYKLKTFQVVHAPSISLGKAESAEDVVPLLRAIFRDACDADREHFIVLAVDARLGILGYKILGSGTTTACLLAPKDVFGVAMAFRTASALLVAHSHPSQSAAPSDSDYELSRRLIAAGEILGIPVIDHLVLASSGAPDSAWRSAMPARATTRVTG